MGVFGIDGVWVHLVFVALLVLCLKRFMARFSTEGGFFVHDQEDNFCAQESRIDKLVNEQLLNRIVLNKMKCTKRFSKGLYN